jgi:hypothetical protein
MVFLSGAKSLARRCLALFRRKVEAEDTSKGSFRAGLVPAVEDGEWVKHSE